MTIKDHRELVCWQRSVELRRHVYALIAKPEVRADRDFCQQILASARSATGNIAEGFGGPTPCSADTSISLSDPFRKPLIVSTRRSKAVI
jgi:hypothetical protein